MRAPGLIGTIQLAVVVVFALFPALFGLQMVAEGRTLGFVFLAIAGLMLLLSHFLTNPLDPGDIAQAVAGRVFGDDENE